MLPVPGLAFQRCVSKLHMIRNCKVLVVIAGYSPPTGTPSPSPPKGTPSPSPPQALQAQALPHLQVCKATCGCSHALTDRRCVWRMLPLPGLAFQSCVSKLHIIRNFKVLVVIAGYSPPTGTPSPRLQATALPQALQAPALLRAHQAPALPQALQAPALPHLQVCKATCGCNHALTGRRFV